MMGLSKKRKGVTLVELLLTLALLSIVMAVAYSVFFTGNKSYKTSTNIGFAQQDSRLIVDFINRELKGIEKLYLEEPVEHHYTLGLNADKRLQISNSSDGSKKVIGSPIESIEFLVIKYTVEGEEGEEDEERVDNRRIQLAVKKNENGYVKEYTTDIFFENKDVLDDELEETSATIIYYTRYED